MTALARYARDRRLPARAGQPDLALPTDDELRERHAAGLAALLGGPPVELELLHARWKPGVAVAGTWRATTADGDAALLALKHHRSPKAADRAVRAAAGAPLWTADDGRTLLFRPEADRHLPGLARLHGAEGMRLLARALREADALGGHGLRKRRTTLELLRYKPERRAVLRVDAHTRDEHGGRDRRLLGLRVLPPARAAAVARARRELLAAGAGDLVPALLAHEPRGGWLVEPWLEGVVDEEATRAAAGGVGALLARLHAAPLPPGRPPRVADLPPSPPPELQTAGPLLGQLAEDLLGRLPRQLPRAAVLGHGDLHADQVLLRDGRPAALVDLDDLAPADPTADLASWVADELALRPELDLAAAASPLLEGYGALTPADLAPATARALVERAAAGVRRLQEGALEQAATYLATAREVLR